MAGHKRPNHGVPVCPYPTRRGISNFDSNALPRPEAWHRMNSEEAEPEVTSLADDGQLSNFSWVPNEPADDSAPDELEHAEEEEKVWEEDDGVGSDSREFQSSSSSVRRTISEALMNSVPLASLFSTPRQDIPAISRAARRRKLHMGVIRRGDAQNQSVKSEDADAIHEANIGRPNSCWIVMGRDQDAVSHLLDLDERDAKHQQASVLSSSTNPKVGAYPLDPRSIRMSFLDVIIAGAIGGIVVFYGLSVM